jgi:hypothetical protein
MNEEFKRNGNTKIESVKQTGKHNGKEMLEETEEQRQIRLEENREKSERE